MATTSKIQRRRQNALAEGGSEYAARRADLIRIAAQLFQEKGYAATRLIDIAHIAGLDRATVYYYVGSKEELFREVSERVLSDNIAHARTVAADDTLSWSEKLRDVMTFLMLSYAENYPFTYVYIQEQMHLVSSDQSAWAQEITRNTQSFAEQVKDILQAAITAGELRDDISPMVAANALFGLFNWTHRWFRPDKAISATEVAANFCSIFLRGMAPASEINPRSGGPSGFPTFDDGIGQIGR